MKPKLFNRVKKHKRLINNKNQERDLSDWLGESNKIKES